MGQLFELTSLHKKAGDDENGEDEHGEQEEEGIDSSLGLGGGAGGGLGLAALLLLPVGAASEQLGFGPGQRFGLLADGGIERGQELRKVLPAGGSHAVLRDGLHALAVFLPVLRERGQLLLRLVAQACWFRRASKRGWSCTICIALFGARCVCYFIFPVKNTYVSWLSMMEQLLLSE